MNISQKEYRSLDAVSRSDLWEANKSPLHYKYQAEFGNKKDSKALVFGSLVHKLVLEADKFDDEFAIAPNVDRRTKAGKEEYDRFLIESEGKMIVTLEDYEIACAMAKVVQNHPEASRLLYEGKPQYEQSFTWLDSQSGINCKIRPDCLNELDGQKYIIDYKTTDSCADGHFERSAKKYGYQLQVGMYSEGMFNQDFDDYKFIFIAQEKTEPYAVRIYDVDDSYRDFGMDLFHELTLKIAHCYEADKFEGYDRCTLTEGDY